MKTKVVQFGGETTTLYFAESIGWTADFSKYLQHVSNFDLLEYGLVEDGHQMVKTILRFHASTSNFNKRKIENLINESMTNLPRVYRLVLTALEHRG